MRSAKWVVAAVVHFRPCGLVVFSFWASILAARAKACWYWEEVHWEAKPLTVGLRCLRKTLLWGVSRCCRRGAGDGEVGFGEVGVGGTAVGET